MPQSELTTRYEEVVFIPSGGESLCTVITRPIKASNDTAIILLHPVPGTNPSFHRDRLWVHAARRLAVDGFTVVRFDARGVGDSSGTANQFRLDHPFLDDLDSVYRYLESLGMHTFGLVGHCAGGRTALAYAARSGDTWALILIQMPLRDYVKGERGQSFIESFAEQADFGTLLRRGLRWKVVKGLGNAHQRKRYRQAISARMRSRVARDSRRAERGGPDRPGATISGEVQNGLTTLAARRVPVLLIYGERDLEYRDARDFDVDGSTPGRIAMGSWPDVRTLAAEQDLLGLPSVAARASLVDCLTEWLVERLPTGRRS